MRIKRLNTQLYDEITETIDGLVNTRGDQKAGVLKSTVPAIEQNDVVRFSEVESEVSENAVDSSLYVHRFIEQTPDTFTGNLKFNTVPPPGYAPEDLDRPACVADVDAIAEDLVGFNQDDVILRDGSRPIKRAVAVTDVTQDGDTLPVSINDVFYKRPVSFRTIRDFLQNSHPLYDTDLSRVVSRVEFIRDHLLKLDHPEIQTLGGDITNAFVRIDYDTYLQSPITLDEHVVNARYVYDLFSSLFDISVLEYDQETSLDFRLKLVRFSVGNQSELDGAGDRIATLENIATDTHKHIAPDKEVQVGWVVRRPTPQFSTNHIPVTGGRVLLRGQSVALEDQPSITVPNTEASEAASNQINSPPGSNKNRASYVLISSKNIEFKWRD